MALGTERVGLESRDVDGRSCPVTLAQSAIPFTLLTSLHLPSSRLTASPLVGFRSWREMAGPGGHGRTSTELGIREKWHKFWLRHNLR